MMLVNGQISDSVSVLDRGLAYGDGVFRTLRCRAGRPLWWGDHYRKLAADCAALELSCPNEQLLRDEVEQVAAGQDCVAKLIVTRGAGARGYAPGKGPATRIVMASPLPAPAGLDSPGDVRVRLCALRFAAQPRLAGIKHLNRLENVLARAEWSDTAIFEGLVCEASGHLVSGTHSNLLWVQAGELHTHPLDTCGIAGVTRERLLHQAQKLGVRVRFERQLPAGILSADEVLICNSLIGVRRVAQLDAHVLPESGWRSRLEECLHEETD